MELGVWLAATKEWSTSYFNPATIETNIVQTIEQVSQSVTMHAFVCFFLKE